MCFYQDSPCEVPGRVTFVALDEGDAVGVSKETGDEDVVSSFVVIAIAEDDCVATV